MADEQGYPKVEIRSNIMTRSLRKNPVIDGLGTTVFKYMKQHENKIAQIDAITGERETFGRLLKKSVRTALHMRAKGIQPGDVITICSNNHLNTYVPLLASWMLGASVASTVPQMSVTETVFLLKQVSPKIIFVAPEGTDLIKNTVIQGELKADIVIFGNTEKYASFQEFIAPVEGENEFVPFIVNNVKDTALICFSSGTTGTPKGICINHVGITLSLLQEEIPPFETVLLASSAPYWISSTLYLMRSIIWGATRVIISEFHPIKVWDWIKTYQVNVIFLATAHWITISKHGLPDLSYISSLKLALIGGSNVTKKQMYTLRQMLPNVVLTNGYGFSEASGVGFGFMPLTDPLHLTKYKENPQALGWLPCGSECKVVDIETEKKLGPNETGELRFKSDYSMNGYCNVDSSTAWDSEGFLKTGDLVYYDDDLCFHYVDRMKEMIKYRSWQVSPVHIEGILLTHPCVKNAIVVGMPHPEDGDHPIAVVELHKPTTETHIQNYVDEKVSDSYKLRGGVKFIDKIPLSQTGKNQRMFVKNLLKEGKI